MRNLSIFPVRSDKFLFRTFFFFTILFLTSAMKAQSVEQDSAKAEPAIVLGEKHKITSSILGEDRPYSVFLPQSYNNETYTPGSYPVFFMIPDGGVVGKTFMELMSSETIIPEMIVIDIPLSWDEYHDYLTPTQNNTLWDGREIELLSKSGRADKFLAFLSDELLPHIDSTYRTKPYRVLFGNSIAGLFTAHAFLSQTHNFQGFIVSEPSLWWDDQVVLKMLEQRMSEGENLEGNVFLALAKQPREDSDRKEMDIPINNFADLLGSKEAENLHFRFQMYPDKNHGSVIPFSIYDGLKHIFQGYEPVPGQFAERPESILPHFQKVSERLAITLLPPEKLLDRIGSWQVYDANATDETDHNKLQKGLEVLKINAELYPDSYHAHQALADTHLKIGNKEMARKHYERSLVLNPQNEHAQDHLEALKP
ncbi:hypothetical protein LB450_08415 [Psychroflexus sp. CAK1W]|uniref:alpha/beta hydrolase-fold protein n=1 Tax=Psychroflexus curvus TaxID=2873595 RepID=UPI001CCEAC07|nr:alpha/beta hydrolase-fold protein [Psychroflexus curvus]MBZ9628119.1 hypothetical protein [Psychroflexus curvus]